jgi:hypothetical protein
VRAALIAGVALVLAAGAYVFLTRESAPPVEEAPVAESRPAPVARPAAPKASPSEPAPETERRAPRRRAEPEAVEPTPAAPAAPAAATTATLVLDSDVPGASVFLNREYVGTTPLRLADLEPGARQIKLTAEGYDGIERSVDLTAGSNEVSMRFKEVRLNKRLAVAHKHGMGGGCEGTLIATLDGLTYETTNKNDAFKLTYEQIETFTVDYLEKNLRVKQKGGKTWNFTDRNAANADALFVLHRDVEAARKKLAQGYTPVR